ncbi:hypothetical protein CO669_17270 [Bradyrhizobium sp. Y36]|uniref:hypothetical protein n=1 Tax=Bradyrhizobium sp. Y36 TaxID=2035447 RepID=UPI000BE94153|nr:hypothetical protein [Bradyrhizobium sp. Y36]PDT88886.1 hypothetical protein CO669_17270 [Bradyrhizobium sp. Y36]
MNLRASIIAMCVGAAFFGVGYAWNYQPDIIDPDEVWSAFQSDHRKARAAVSRLLIEPHSARFTGLRTVEADAARYVCGAVKAMNNSGHYVDAAFVYTVASDFARVDDDGRITSRQSPYKPCPTAADDSIAERQTPIAPGAFVVAKTVGRVIPRSGGGTMEQQLGQLAAQTAAVAPESGSSLSPVGTGPALARPPAGSEAKTPAESDLTWQADRPPVTWPALASDQCPTRSTQLPTAAEALALAKDIEARWQRSKPLEVPAKRLLSEEIKKARCALLAIDPLDKEYPQAWAAFVRLRNVDRDLAG